MDIKLLQHIRLFAALDENDLQALAKHFVQRHHPKNSIIINEGDSTNSLYIILSGRVKVFLNDENGKEVTLNVEGPGEYFGEVSLFDDGKRSASVITLENCQFAILEKQEFLNCIGQNPTLAISIIQGLTGRLRALSENVRSLALMDVYGRVAHTLLEMAHEQDGHWVIDEKLTHVELANRVGASSKMVSRIMQDLKKGGYITKNAKQIIIERPLPPAW
ncbi:MAG: Crp/Fnr family transcriptional regulator [Gammaproteobacteria bacterium]|nr:Crp/Fnr family transcriptional regulator [Gammaproteobacteria bacterium]